MPGIELPRKVCCLHCINGKCKDIAPMGSELKLRVRCKLESKNNFTWKKLDDYCSQYVEEK